MRGRPIKRTLRDEETFNAHTTGVLCEHGRLYFTLTPGETYIPVDALVHLERQTPDRDY